MGWRIGCPTRQSSGPALVVCVEVPALMVEVQVIGVEHGDVHQSGHVEDLQLFSFELDQSVTPQFLERAINVHGRQPGRIREIVLGEREIAPPVMSSADRVQTHVEFNEQMREPLIGAALSKVERPLTLDSRGDKLVPPERLSDPRSLRRESIHFFGRDHGHFEPGDRTDAVIHCFEDVDVDVAEIPRNEEGDDLPLSIGKLLVTASPAVEDKMDKARLVTLGDQVAACIDEPEIPADLRKCRTVVGRESRVRLKLGYHRRS